MTATKFRILGLMGSMLVWLCLIDMPARAEGTDQLNTTQALRAGTQLYVDILNPGTESIEWTGVGQAVITAPGGSAVATLSSGQSAGTADDGAGVYGVRVQQGQVVDVPWDVTVLGQVAPGGRLHSYDWRFNAGQFSATRATFASFYAILPGGQAGTDAVVELKLDGLAGYVYNINANRVGVYGPDAGRSVSMWGHTVIPEFPIYIAPPTVATYGRVTPQVFGLDFIGGVSEDAEGSQVAPCDEVVPEQSFGRFQFYTDVEGTYHLQCDLDGDGQFESTNNDDLLVVGACNAGVNTVLWDGTHQGGPVAFGTYNCRVRINVGEFHYVGSDIETSYQGMRMYEVASDGSRRSLVMYWNDQDVQSATNAMLNGAVGLVTSGESGMDSGNYEDDAVANVNARSWGNFTWSGKGNQNYLDTYVWLASSISTSIEVEAVDAGVDTDGDGLSDFEEACFYGTDPENIDTDGDGVDDGTQYLSGSSSGSVGGLESNGRLAEKLARRAIANTRYSPDLIGWGERVSAQGSALNESENTPLPAVLNTVELAGLQGVESTPGDIPELTNGTNVFARDFVDKAGKVLGSILAVETIGELYEHSKALCDRAGGSTLLAAGPVGERRLVGASYRNVEERTLDQAAELKLYETQGKFAVQSHWLRQDYAAPEKDQRIVNVQAWGRRPGMAGQLADALLDALHVQGLLHVVVTEPLDEGNGESEVAAEPLSSPSHSSTSLRMLAATSSYPTAVITQAELLGDTLRVAVDHFAGEGGEGLTLRISPLGTDSQSLASVTHELAPAEGLTHIQVKVGLVLEVTVDLLLGGRLVDQLWLADGAWARFADDLWGGSTDIDEFDSTCAASANSITDASPETSPETIAGQGSEGQTLALAGCAHMTARKVDQFAGVARHIPRGVSLDGYRSLAMWCQSDRAVEVCAEDTRFGQRSCAHFDAAPDGHFIELDLSKLKAVGAKVRLVTVTQQIAGQMQVSNLAFSSLAAETQSRVRETNPSSNAGCSVGAGAPGGHSPVWYAAVVGLFARRLRRRRGEPSNRRARRD